MAIDLTETSALDKKLKLEHLPFTKKIDNFVTNVGEIFNWFWVILVAVILINVIRVAFFRRGIYPPLRHFLSRDFLVPV